MRYFLQFICCFLTLSLFSEEQLPEELLLSDPEQVGTFTIGSSDLVGGLISPLSGQVVLKKTDLIAQGAQEIILSRIYTPRQIPVSFDHDVHHLNRKGKPLRKSIRKHNEKHNQEEYEKKSLHAHLYQTPGGWSFFPHLRLKGSYPIVRFADPNGVALEFNILRPHSSGILASPPYGISNVVGGVPSGTYDPRNTRIFCEGEGYTFIVNAPDGTIRFYGHGRATKDKPEYLLDKEILPNGKVLRYRYNQNYQLVSVESLDPQERYIYATLHVTGSDLMGNQHFITSSGITADYNYQTRVFHIKIKEKQEHHGNHREENNFPCPPILTSVSSPFYRHETLNYSDRFLLDSYSGENDSFTCYNIGFGENTPHYRVHQLSFPVGQNDGFHPIFTLHYEPAIAGQKAGNTTVQNSDGTSTTYHFSKNLLITAIQYLGQNGALKKEKLFSWSPNNWLQAVELKDSQSTLYKRSYEYDSFGNPLLEVFTGNLTGNGKESYTTKREFSQDGRNLLLKEETEEGKVLCFSYLPNTNLVISKLTKEGNTILLREFSEYDDCHNLIREISDDGNTEDTHNLSGVTERITIQYSLRQQAPFLHMPEWVEEKYLEDGIENLLKHTHLIYDQYGNVAQEEIYDANGQFTYTLHKEYNERGDLLSETNPLGQKAIYEYDAKGNLLTTANFSNRLKTTLRYDARNRLREKKEMGDDNIIHSTLSHYDPQDRLIEKIDPFQNTTKYFYDPIVNQVIKTDFPSISTPEGEMAVSISSTYDSFGREITKTDANGSITTYCYNAYGSPIEITHPDGSKETFRYTKNGILLNHTDPDGLKVCYIRDALGRVLSKTYSSSEGKSLAEESFTYSGFHLLSETDKEGHVTHYSYDGAGRKIREEFCGRVIDFSYDSLGRLSIIREYNGVNTLLTHYKRDLLARILEESKIDSSGHLLYQIGYAYDADGNQSRITRFINDQQAVDHFTYDSCCRLIEHCDPLSYMSKVRYDESYANQLGQWVLQITTTDPCNIATVETQDALARPVKKEILNAQGITLSYQERFCDPAGNLSYQRDHVYENGCFRNSQTTHYTYTSSNQVASITRAFGNQNARRTEYTYTPSGKIATKILPDDITLFYRYEPLGFLSALDSSDGRIRHRFTYDKLGRLTSALDKKEQIAIERTLDPFGNMVREIFPSGLAVEKSYDDCNRLTILKMAAEGEIHYTYGPLFLREIARTKDGRVLYLHKYEAYDLTGNLLSEELLGNLGRVTHRADLKGRKATISSPYFFQECLYNPCGNLLCNTIDGIQYSYSYDELSQLVSEQGPSYPLVYTYDSLYNKTTGNGRVAKTNDLNELLSLEGTNCSYDNKGNQVSKSTLSETMHFTYDPLNRLTDATNQKIKVHFSYDPLGRRLSKTVHTASSYTWSGWKETLSEHYLYDGQQEIGAFISTTPRALRVLSGQPNPMTIAIELDGKVFAPLLDAQGNIRRLVDPSSKTITAYEFSAFGEERQQTTDRNPWRFASKRWDSELGLIYFGKRYYDPELSRWLTTDPAGFVDGVNLYQYLFNNPFRYVDPEGKNAFALVFSILEITFGAVTFPIWGPTAAVVGVAAVGLWAGHELYKYHERQQQRSYYSPDYANYGRVLETNVENEERLRISKKKRSSHPDPDPKAEGHPHTIIERPGAKGQYTTFDAEGSKQYRGSGKPHGDISRPNVKEIKIDESPKGRFHEKPTVREAKPEEIPKG